MSDDSKESCPKFRDVSLNSKHSAMRWLLEDDYPDIPGEAQTNPCTDERAPPWSVHGPRVRWFQALLTTLLSVTRRPEMSVPLTDLQYPYRPDRPGERSRDPASTGTQCRKPNTLRGYAAGMWRAGYRPLLSSTYNHTHRHYIIYTPPLIIELENCYQPL